MHGNTHDMERQRKDAEERPDTDFEVGDRVRVSNLENDYVKYYSEDERGTVLDREQKGPMDLVKIEWDDPASGFPDKSWVKPERLTKID